VTDDERTAVLDRVKEIITGDKGVIVRIDEWGKKRLAFEIKDAQDGFYYILFFGATAQTLAEVTRVLGITDTVLRFMPIRHERAFGQPSPASSAKAPASAKPEE
jgi:small subunit ribosomal protein S6